MAISLDVRGVLCGLMKSIKTKSKLIPGLITYILPVIALYSVWLAPFELAFFSSISKASFNISGYSVDGIFFFVVIRSIVTIVRSEPGNWSELVIWSEPVTCNPLVKKGCYLMLEITASIFAIIHAICTLRTNPYVHLAFVCSVMRLLRVFRIGWVNDLFARCERNLVHIYYAVIRYARLALGVSISPVHMFLKLIDLLLSNFLEDVLQTVLSPRKLFVRTTLAIGHVLGTILTMYLTTFLVVHFEGCMFYLLAAQNHTQNTWIDTIHVKHVFVGYVDSIYWSMTTVTSTGYGDLHPVNTNEKIYTVVAMLCNLALLCYVTGNCTEIIISTSCHTQSYRQTRQSLVDYAKEKGIPNEVQKSMLDYIKDDFENSKFPKDILKRLPESVKLKVNQHLFGTLLDKVYLFKETSAIVLNQLIGEIEIVSYPAGDIVINQNDDPQAFYILISGLVKFKKTNNGEEGDQMSIEMKDAGDVIGDFGVFGERRQPLNVSTLTFTNLLKMNAEKCFAILEENNLKEKVKHNFTQYVGTLNHPIFDGILPDTEVP